MGQLRELELEIDKMRGLILKLYNEKRDPSKEVLLNNYERKAAELEMRRQQLGSGRLAIVFGQCLSDGQTSDFSVSYIGLEKEEAINVFITNYPKIKVLKIDVKYFQTGKIFLGSKALLE